MQDDPPDGHQKPFGRRRRLSEADRDVVVALYSAGCSRAWVAEYLGVSPQTLTNTAAREPDFDARLKIARARPRVDHARKVKAASIGSWRASAWMLERMAPERFRDPEGLADRLISDIERIVSQEIDDAEGAPSARASRLRRLLAEVVRGALTPDKLISDGADGSFKDRRSA